MKRRSRFEFARERRIRAACSQTSAAFPRIQALPGTDATRGYNCLNTWGLLDKHHMVFRLGYTEVRRVPVVGGLGATFRRRASRLGITPDGKAYAYSYSRELSELFIVENVH
jgi:uncharacterized protein YqjF (DUF2071 family)